MKLKWLSFAALVTVATVLVVTPSCARSQKLLAINVTPSGATITLTGPGQQVQTQFTAYGAYIHPPETRDITKTVIWATDTPSIIEAVQSTPGLFQTTGEGCGTNLGITATVYTDNNNPSGNVVIGNATMNVTFQGSCP